MIEALAPAKVNLALAVIGRRSDGFHDLVSVFVRVGLADRLSVDVAGPAEGLELGGPDDLTVAGASPSPVAGVDLVLHAAGLLREHAGRTLPTLRLALEKHIPSAAGLGGGSSDAAAAIDAALEAWGASVAPEERVALAAAIGSDVPLFMVAGPALVEGRGERVTPLHGVRRRGGEAVPGVLLVTPAVAVHTADVFAAWSAGAMSEPGVARRTSEHFASEFGSGLGVAHLLERPAVLASANDLAAAAAAVVPELVPFRRAVMRLLGRPVGLSGSGPTLWVLYPSLDEAQAAAAVVNAALKDRLSAPGESAPFVTATTIAPVRQADEAPAENAAVASGGQTRRSSG